MSLQLKEAPENWYQNKDIVKIQQSEIAFSDTFREIIASSGAGPCVILILLDKIGHQGWMSHIFSSAEISPCSLSGKGLINTCIERYANGLIDIYLIGGYHIVSYMLIQSIEAFINHLETKLNINKVHRHLYQNWVSNIVFDFKHHQIYKYEVNCDKSFPRKLDCAQGLLTSFTHLLPCVALIEYPPNTHQKNK